MIVRVDTSRKWGPIPSTLLLGAVCTILMWADEKNAPPDGVWADVAGTGWSSPRYTEWVPIKPVVAALGRVVTRGPAPVPDSRRAAT